MRINHRLANGIQEVVGSIPIGSTRTTYQSSRSYNRRSRRPGHRPVRCVWNCLGSSTTSRQPKVISPKPGHTGYRWHPAQTDGTFAGQFGRTLFRNCLPEMEEGGSEVFNRTGQVVRADRQTRIEKPYSELELRWTSGGPEALLHFGTNAKRIVAKGGTRTPTGRTPQDPESE